MSHPNVENSDRESGNDVTQLLNAWKGGDQQAGQQVLGLVYQELHRLARHYMGKERSGHSLQSTDLIHEAYLRLLGQRSGWQNRAHFFAIAAQEMRRILADHARRKMAEIHGGRQQRVAFDDALALATSDPGFCDIDEALARLEKDHQRVVRVIEMKFFGGLTEEEIAHVLDIDRRTVQRDWFFGRAWLQRALPVGPDHEPR